MIFSNDKPIYIQMADRLCDEILSGVYQDDDRIPSVREYAVLLPLLAVFNYWASFHIFKNLQLITNKWLNYDFHKR